MKMNNPTTGSELQGYINELYGGDVEIWGDSLTNFLGAPVSALLGRDVDQNNHGGKRSSYIRDLFIANADITKSQIFYLGRNNIGDTDVIISDLKTMINHLGHNRYVVLTVPNGGYANEILSNMGADNAFSRFENRIANAFPDNNIQSRKAIIEGWGYGNIRLNESFVQPLLNNNIQINVTDTSFLTTENASYASTFPTWSGKIRIGNFYAADLYEVVSVDSANLMTVKLLEANKIAEGGNVENITYAPDGDVGYLNVLQELDWQSYNENTQPSSFCGDNIHPTTDGDLYVANLIAKFFNRKFI